MSTKSAHRSPRSLGQAVTHPISTISFAAGLVRGVAAAILRAASGAGGPAHAEWIAPPEPVTEEALDEPTYTVEVQLGEHLTPAPPRVPGQPGEAFATEPSAVTRSSAHSGGGADQEIDDWYGEQDAPEPPTGVVESLEFGDRHR